MWLLWWMACGSGHEATLRSAPPSTVQDTVVTSPTRPDRPRDTGTGSADTDPPSDTSPATHAETSDTGVYDGPCPVGMVLIDDLFCIDRYEASIEGHSPYEIPGVGEGAAISVEGVAPQGYISGTAAQAACELAGKRLCMVDEWLRACQGPDGWVYPYGNTYNPDACNTSCAQHPIVSYWGSDPNRWDSDHMNDPGINQQPGTLDPTGGNPDCVSHEGVYDLHGNLHEWIADPNGTFKGGFYADASINGSGCFYATTAHSFDYHDYSTGFRCCADL